MSEIVTVYLNGRAVLRGTMKQAIRWSELAKLKPDDVVDVRMDFPLVV